MLCTQHVPLLTRVGQDDPDTGLETDREFPIPTTPIDTRTEPQMMDQRDKPEVGY